MTRATLPGGAPSLQELRGLVRKLERAAQPGGEPMRLLDGLAELAYAGAAHEHAQA